MPPPMINPFTFCNRFRATPILSETFAPPRMARKGRSGSFRASSRYAISFFIRNPAATSPTNSTIPKVEACALWAAPKASFTYTSAKAARDFANSGSFSVSSLW